MKTLKLFFANVSRKATALMVAMSAMVMVSIPSLAASSSLDLSTGVLPADSFDPLVTAITSNIGVILPSLIVVAGLIIAIGLGFGLIKKHAKA